MSWKPISISVFSVLAGAALCELLLKGVIAEEAPGWNAGLPRQHKSKWLVQDGNRPQPTVVTPAKEPGGPPSDAVVLFDGKDLSGWTTAKGEPAAWTVENGYMEVAKGKGDIQTKQGFGDCQLHVEWAAPEVVVGESQGRGNSGVFLMSTYEIQVLDCYNNKTYADGSAGSVYGQYPPLVNACRKPGEWQAYDIVFHAPRFDADGKLLAPARFTVFHNGVLIQDNEEATGPTGHHVRPPYAAHAAKMPLKLQDHGNPVRFRNIWIREI